MIAIATAIGVALLPQSAAAQQTVYAAGQPGVVGGFATLPVNVTASVGGHCGFATGSAPSGSYSQPDFDVNGLNHDFSFVLDCTGPSRVAVVSTNGGLLTAGAAPSGYATLAPYTVTLNLVGSTTTANQSCAVATLTASTGTPCSFRGPVSASQGLLLNSTSVSQPGTYLRVSAPAYSGPSTLVQGSYSDTLTVTVSAAS
ncbi:MAG: hypothetical protein ACTHJR_03230 [Sphingomonas sp.]|uniref:hypothetical protein n=1 Tax=Sphingomonas sp. TaxID=28214 RepID=UPI003F80C94E